MKKINKLFKYSYYSLCQGDMEIGVEYALLHVPEDATFNNNRSVLMSRRYKKHTHEIVLDSVQDLTINF